MPTEYDDGLWFRSNEETFSLGNNINVKLDCLQSARNFIAPEVAEIVIRIAGTVNSSAGTDASGFDACKLVDRFRLVDKQEVFNVSGEGLRLNGIIELGERWEDMTTLTAAAADAARTFRIVIPCELPKSRRPRDTRIPLQHFLEGGEIQISCAAALPTGWDDFTSGKVRVYFRVCDGRRPELKSRLTIMEKAMTLQEFNYDVHGSARTLVGYTKLTTTSMSSWAAFTQINSTTLRLPSNFEVDILRMRYRLNTDGLHVLDPILAATPLALPFITPDRVQKIGSMPNLETCHIDLGAAPPAAARLMVVAIKDRDPQLAALVANYANVGDLQAALQVGGEIVSAKGKNAPVTTYDAVLARRMPARVNTGGIVP